MWSHGDPVLIPWHPLRARLVGDWGDGPGSACARRFRDVGDGRVEFGLMLGAGAAERFWWSVHTPRWDRDVLRFGVEVGRHGESAPFGRGRIMAAVWVSGGDRVIAVETWAPDRVDAVLGFWWRVG